MITIRLLRSALLACVFALPASAEGWNYTTPLPLSYWWTKSAATDSHVYKVGGLSNHGICRSRDVLFAPINADGTLGAWTLTTPLPALVADTRQMFCAGIEYTVPTIMNAWGHDAIIAADHIYHIGGVNSNLLTGMTVSGSSTVFHAAINPDGSLGPWLATADLPVYAWGSAAAHWNGYLYVSGGRPNFPGSFLTPSPDTYFARINPDGSLQPWQKSAATLPVGLNLHRMVAAEGNLYVAGGLTGENFTNGVYRAPINPDGSIGNWETEAPLPQPVGTHGLLVRHGILYSIAGSTPFETNLVYSSPINPDGTLKGWTAAPSLPATRFNFGSSTDGESLYVLGGVQSSIRNDAFYLPDEVPPAAATIAGESLSGTAIRLSWDATGNDDVYGAVAGGRYDIRYSQNPADFASFDAIPGQVQVPADYEPGEAQNATVGGLAPGTEYHFALKTIDRAGNASAMSDVATARTFYRATSAEFPPIVTLDTPISGFTVTVAPVADSTVALQKAPGTLVSPVYELSPSGASLNPSGILTFSFDASVDPTGLAIYKYIDSTTGWSTDPITSQVIDTVNRTVTGRIASTSMYALFIPKKPSSSIVFSAELNPKTLNLKSHGKNVTVYIEAASPTSSVSDIDAKSVSIIAVNEQSVSPLGVSNKNPALGDGNSNGIPDLTLKFDRRKLQRLLSPGAFRLTLHGRLKGGKDFESIATGTATKPGSSKKTETQVQFWPAEGELKWLLSLTTATPEAYISLWPNKKRVSSGRYAVNVPASEKFETSRITVSRDVDRHADRPSRVRAAEKAGLTGASEPIDFGPSGTKFETVVSIELPYDRSQLLAGTPEGDLAVFYWNANASAWEKIPSTVDKLRQVVHGLTDHFSVYQVFAQSASPLAVSDFGEVYAFPNPARPGSHPTFHVEAPGADTVAIRVYDVSGARRHEKTVTGSSPFESTWDVSGVASGVYYYVIEASGGGSSRRKTGKLAVIK